MPPSYTTRFADHGRGPVLLADWGGKGRPIVLVHGLGGSHVNWAAVAGAMTEFGHVTAIDLIGHGLTPVAGRVSAVEDNRRVLSAYLRSLGRPALVVGNSMGGAIALEQAYFEPETVSGLALVSPAAPLTLGELPEPMVAAVFGAYLMPGLGEALLAWRTRRADPRVVVDVLLRVLSYDSGRIDPAMVDLHLDIARRRRHMPGIERAFLQATRSILGVLLRRRRFYRMVAATPVHSLVIGGAYDRLVHPRSLLKLGEIRPDWEVEIHEDVGHIAMLEVPLRFVERVAEWAERYTQS